MEHIFSGIAPSYHFNCYVCDMAQALIVIFPVGYSRTLVPTSFCGLPDTILTDPYASLFGVGRSHLVALRTLSVLSESTIS